MIPHRRTPIPPQITQAQKEHLLELIQEAEYDARTITLMYRNLGVDDRWQGHPVDTWLNSLDRVEATRIIERLQSYLR